MILAALTALAPVRSAADVLRPPDSLHRSSSRVRPNWESLIFTRLDPGDTRLVPGAGSHDRRRRRSPGVQLTSAQLLSLMSESLTYQQDLHFVAQTLTLLKQLGVTVVLKQPRGVGAAGEWIPHTRTIRIRPDIPSLSLIHI